MNVPKKQYAIADKIPAATRNILILALAFVGFTLQMFVHVFLGLFLLFPAMLLCIPKGAENRPKLSGTPEWKTATIEEFKKLDLLMEANDRFKSKSGGFSLNTAKGCGGCLLFLVFVAFGAIVLSSISPAMSEADALEPVARGGNLAIVFVIDALALVGPLWIWGSIKTWEPPNLRKRYAQLNYIYEKLKDDKYLEFVPNLHIRKSSKGDVPIDCKLTANIKDAPGEFLGIQVQTSLNSVQGTTYPYTYCVLVAKPEFELAKKAKRLIDIPKEGRFKTSLFATDNEKKESKFARYNDALIEIKKENDVEIAVVRQNTKGTGYTTSTDQAFYIFSTAYMLAKNILKQ